MKWIYQTITGSSEVRFCFSFQLFNFMRVIIVSYNVNADNILMNRRDEVRIMNACFIMLCMWVYGILYTIVLLSYIIWLLYTIYEQLNVHVIMHIVHMNSNAPIKDDKYFIYQMFGSRLWKWFNWCLMLSRSWHVYFLMNMKTFLFCVGFMVW